MKVFRQIGANEKLANRRTAPFLYEDHVGAMWTNGAEGVARYLGGKWTTYRLMAQETIDVFTRVAVRRIAQDAARPGGTRTESHRALEPGDDCASRQHSRAAAEKP